MHHETTLQGRLTQTLVAFVIWAGEAAWVFCFSEEWQRARNCTIIVGAVLTLEYTPLRPLLRNLLARAVSKGLEPEKIHMDNSRSQPMCLGCNSHNVRQLLDDTKGSWQKRCFLPKGCTRCSWRPRHEGIEKVTIHITDQEMKETTLLAGHHDCKVRDTQSSVYNRFDDRRSAFSIRDVLLAENMGYLDRLETTACSYNTHTGRYRLASSWEYHRVETEKTTVEEPPLPMVPGPLRRLWDFFGRHASIPHQVSTTDSRRDARVEALLPDCPGPDAGTIIASDANFAEEIPLPVCKSDTPGERYTAASIPGTDAVRIGPLLRPTSVWAPGCNDNRVAGLALRSEPQNLYKSSAESSRRLALFMSRVSTQVFTPEAIAAAADIVDEEHPTIESLISAKFSPEMRQKAVEAMAAGDKPHPRKANVKLELGTAGKAPRLVIDEGIEAQAVIVYLAKIYETLLTHPKVGIFYSMSIKYQARNTVLDGVVKEWKSVGSNKKAGDIVAVEVDQTGMELHQRFKRPSGGILGPIYAALTKIQHVVHSRLNAKLSHVAIDKIWFEVENGMRVSFKVGAKGQERSRTVHYDDVFMTSGWRMTSIVNFMDELAATYCAMTRNPERLLAKHQTGEHAGKFRLQTGKHDFTFLNEDGKSARLRLWVEGDDVVGYASRSFMAKQDHIESNYRDMGYTSKLKFVADGRAEFIGAHFTVVKGVVVGDWVPNFTRYIAKIGIYAGRRPCAASYVARCCSIATMFAGRLPFAATMFHNLALSHAEGVRLETVVTTEAYSEEERAFGEGRFTLTKILEATALALGVNGSSSAEQRVILSGSIGVELDGTDMDRLHALATKMSKDLDDREAFEYLPACLRQ